MKKDKIIIYVDMDHVLCDYDAGFSAHKARHPNLTFPQSQPGLYINLKPIEGALDTFVWLFKQPQFDVYILTAPSIRNPHCYSEKRQWVEQYLGMDVVAKLIISPNKGLNRGHYLIDDCDSGKGQELFEGELIHFGHSDYPDWNTIRKYFEKLVA